MNRRGTIIVCGRIAHLNRDDARPEEDRMPVLLGTILTKWLTVRGFAWSEFESHWDEFVGEVGPLVAAGNIRFREDLVDGLEQIPAAYGRLFDGRNFGKLIARV
jgi:NADPH-dependent curcumin reductase CurA